MTPVTTSGARRFAVVRDEQAVERGQAHARSGIGSVELDQAGFGERLGRQRERGGGNTLAKDEQPDERSARVSGAVAVQDERHVLARPGRAEQLEQRQLVQPCFAQPCPQHLHGGIVTPGQHVRKVLS